MTTQREHPILFSGPMVRALLDGRKTVTRRLVKFTLQHARGDYFHVNGLPPHHDPEGPPGYGYLSLHQVAGYCPYGQPEDRLWVKETWRMPATLDALSPAAAAAKALDAGYRAPWAPVLYVADGDCQNWDTSWGEWGKTRVSIHMPRWASRLTLEVVSVRVERLHDITEGDAVLEGVEPHPRALGWKNYEPDPAFESIAYHTTARESFASLWRSINGAESWDANPWVWRIEVRKVTP